MQDPLCGVYNLEVSAVIPRTLNLRCNISLFIGNLPLLSSDNLERVTALVGAIVSTLVQSRSSATLSHDDVDKDQESVN